MDVLVGFLWRDFAPSALYRNERSWCHCSQPISHYHGHDSSILDRRPDH